MEREKHIEIERKFLVKADFMPFVSCSYAIKQGYILSSKEKTVRVRLTDDKGFITIKGPTNKSGFARFEWEKEISVNEAELLLELCEDVIIDKVRHEVEFKGKLFEVDQFFGENEGLLLAELELSSENEPYEAPEWLGEEVTQNPRYYNAYLSKLPYTKW